jgi:hypothetical protein
MSSTLRRTDRPGRLRRSGVAALVTMAALSLPACATFAEYDSEQDFGLGIRGQVPLERVFSPEGTMGDATVSRLELAGSLHRFTPGDATLLIGNTDLILPLVGLADGSARLYTGAGLHLARLSIGDASDTSVGANLLGGVRFEHRAVAPFFEVRGGIGDYGSLSALAGIRFLTGF